MKFQATLLATLFASSSAFVPSVAPLRTRCVAFFLNYFIIMCVLAWAIGLCPAGRKEEKVIGGDNMAIYAYRESR